MLTNRTKNKTKTRDDVVLKTDCVIIILFKKQNHSHGLHVRIRKIVLIRRFYVWFLVSVSSLNMSLILEINTPSLNTEGIEYESRPNNVDIRILTSFRPIDQNKLVELQ